MTQKNFTTTSSQEGFSSKNNVTSEDEISHNYEGKDTDELAKAVAAPAAEQSVQNKTINQ